MKRAIVGLVLLPLVLDSLAGSSPFATSGGAYAQEVTSTNPTDPSRTSPVAVEQLAVWLGPAETVLGPDQRTDNPFHTLRTTGADSRPSKAAASPDADQLMAYIANGDTYGYTSANLETLDPLPEPVLTRGGSDCV